MKMNQWAFKVWWKISPEVMISQFVYNIVSAVMPYVTIYFSAQLINELAGGRNPERLWKLAILIVGLECLLSVIKAVLFRVYAYYESLNRVRMDKYFTDKMLSMDFCDADSSYVYEWKAEIEQNRNWNRWGLFQVPYQVGQIVNIAAGILGAVVLSASFFFQQVPDESGLAWLNHPLCIVFLIAYITVIIVFSSWCAKKAGNYWASMGKEITFGNRLFFFLDRLFSESERAADIRIYRQESYLKLWKREDNKVFGANGVLGKMSRGRMGGMKVLSEAAAKILTGSIYLLVCLKAWGGAFGVGSVTQYISAITALSGGISALLKLYGDLKNNIPYLERERKLLELPNQMYQGSLSVEKRRDRKYEVEFRDVSFCYPDSSVNALSHVSFRFRIGERLAVVGENGSGKTTMIKLLCRLYDPTEGEILLNGINIRKYNYQEYMNIFSVVFQDFQLLSLPLGENVAGSIEYDLAKAKQCLEEAGLGERLGKMECGLDTYLYHDFDDNGLEVSSGEAQKIAIARALYKDAAFIILDEPTAALDPIAEADIYARFNTLIQDKTAVYISHRLSSCKFCDKIAVFDQGRIAQVGTHEELVTAEGKYAELWQAQAQYYT